jgi:hypothetical protein
MRITQYKYYVYSSIVLAFLFSPSLFTLVLFDQFSISSTLTRYFLLFNTLFIAQSFWPSSWFSKLQRSLMIYLVLVTAYVTIVWVLLYGAGGAGTPKSVIVHSLFGFSFLVILNSRRFDLQDFSLFLVKVAFVFCILSLILYFGAFLGIMKLWSYTPPGHSSLSKWSIGVGGFLNTGASYYTGLSIRNQSYWSESSKFAQYLQFTLFAAYYFFIRNKSRRTLIYLFIISLSFLLTFSVANFFSLLITVSLFLILGSSNYKLLFGNLLVGVIGLYLILQFYELTNQYELNTVLAKNTGKNIENRLGRFELAYKYIVESPFGNKAKSNDTDGAPGALGNLLIDGGFPLLIGTILLMIPFFLKLIKLMRKGRYKLIYMSFVAYFIAFNWYGNYFEIYHLFLLALFTTYFKYDEHNLVIIKAI